MLYKNGYAPELVSRNTNSHLNGLQRDTKIEPENCVFRLKISYIYKICLFGEKY